MRRNAFMARPAHFAGRAWKVVERLPGFHTTNNINLAKRYAYVKMIPYMPNKLTRTLKRGWTHPISDYPVIVSLDMRGLQALPDLDALEFWAEEVLEFLQLFAEQSPCTLGAFRHFVKTYNHPYASMKDPPETTKEALEEIWWILNLENMAWRIYKWIMAQRDPRIALRSILHNPENPNMLMDVSRQYRYDQDIEEKRIIQVQYMRPFFDKLWPHYDDPEWESDQCEKRIDNIEAAGYATVTLGNVSDDQDPAVLQTVYEAPPPREVAEQLHMFGHKPKPRLEYHGTTYKNLCGAARELAKRIPPPPPPYKEDIEGDVGIGEPR